ncbi:methionine/alanine import family NSS transporter small subunit [Sporosarcina sp. 6E9]|nr:methionine/alanine import family NSS transporter small subunit [Sporosarcina sp. 6E9]MBO1915239.1 methionine/alanine import family NSS transporter small subunit [Microvirga sp. 3-52]
MSASAILMMVVGILIIWGGLAASITNAVVKSRRNK